METSSGAHLRGALCLNKSLVNVRERGAVFRPELYIITLESQINKLSLLLRQYPDYFVSWYHLNMIQAHKLRKLNIRKIRKVLLAFLSPSDFVLSKDTCFNPTSNLIIYNKGRELNDTFLIFETMINKETELQDT